MYVPLGKVTCGGCYLDGDSDEQAPEASHIYEDLDSVVRDYEVWRESHLEAQ